MGCSHLSGFLLPTEQLRNIVSQGIENVSGSTSNNRGLVLSCGLASAAQWPGGFRVIGPGRRCHVHPTISPHDPNTVLISCDMTGSYITHDGGRSWRMFNLRGVTRFFVFDPLVSHTMYAEGIGLWRSTDDEEHGNWFIQNLPQSAASKCPPITRKKKFSLNPIPSAPLWHWRSTQRIRAPFRGRRGKRFARVIRLP